MAAPLEWDAQQFSAALIHFRGTVESEPPSSELDEPAAATCNGSQCHCVTGRLKRWHVSCEIPCHSMTDAYMDLTVMLF